MKIIIILSTLFILLNFTLSIQFDYLVMVYHWIPAFCRKGQCLPNLISNHFCIHGMWPAVRKAVYARYDPYDPTFCAQRPVLVLSEIMDLLDELSQGWPSVTAELPDDQLWANQWKKHGTCSYPDISVHDYFSIALNHWRHQDLYQCLINAGITPDDFWYYSRSRVVNVIKHCVSFIPQLACNKNLLGEDELLEIRICYTKDGKYRKNCPREQRCPETFKWRGAGEAIHGVKFNLTTTIKT